MELEEPLVVHLVEEVKIAVSVTTSAVTNGSGSSSSGPPIASLGRLRVRVEATFQPPTHDVDVGRPVGFEQSFGEERRCLTLSALLVRDYRPQVDDAVPSRVLPGEHRRQRHLRGVDAGVTRSNCSDSRRNSKTFGVIALDVLTRSARNASTMSKTLSTLG